MSEAPTLPTNDLRTNRVNYEADRIMNDPNLQDAFFRHAEDQVANVDERLDTWDLYEPAEAFNPDMVPQDATPYTERPDYRTEPLTRAQMIEQPLRYQDTLGMTRYAHDVSKAVVALRRLV